MSAVTGLMVRDPAKGLMVKDPATGLMVRDPALVVSDVVVPEAALKQRLRSSHPRVFASKNNKETKLAVDESGETSEPIEPAKFMESVESKMMSGTLSGQTRRRSCSNCRKTKVSSMPIIYLDSADLCYSVVVYMMCTAMRSLEEPKSL